MSSFEDMAKWSGLFQDRGEDICALTEAISMLYTTSCVLREHAHERLLHFPSLYLELSLSQFCKRLSHPIMRC